MKITYNDVHAWLEEQSKDYAKHEPRRIRTNYEHWLAIQVLEILKETKP